MIPRYDEFTEFNSLCISVDGINYQYTLPSLINIGLILTLIKTKEVMIERAMQGNDLDTLQ